MRKPAYNPKSEKLAATRKAVIAAKGFTPAYSKYADLSDITRAPTKPARLNPQIVKPVVGPPGAQGLAGTPGLITVSIKTAAQYAALTPEQQADPTIWYVIPKTP